jgi:hypothetical protein
MAVNLPRFQRETQLVDANGNPTQTFHMWWDAVSKSLEGSIDVVFASLAIIEVLAPVTITADYTGAVSPSVQLPMTIQAARMQGATDVSADSDWAITASTGNVTASIDTTGLITITGIVGDDSLTVSATYEGTTVSTLLNVTFSVAPAPSTGTDGGTSAFDSTLNSFNSTTMTAVSNALSVVVGASGTVKLSAPLTVSTLSDSNVGVFEVHAIWRVWDGASYVDVGIERASNPDCKIVDLGFSNPQYSDGAISVANTVTGLGVGTTQKYKLYARNDAGTRTMYLSGTISAVGS